VLLLVAALVASTLANNKHGESKKKEYNSRCHYTTTKGKQYDLRLLSLKSGPLILNTTTQSSIFLDLCKPLDPHLTGCPKDTAVCEKTAKGMSISFGKFGKDNFNDGANGNDLEAIFGEGEKCDIDAPRKTVVELKCKPVHSVQMKYEGCMLTLTIESPYACETKEICSQLSPKGKERCHNTAHLCEWDESKKQCVVAANCWYKRHLSVPAFVGIVTSLVAFVACTAGICICAFCRRRRRCRMQTAMPLTPIKKCKRKCKKDAVVAEPQYVYQPLQQLQGSIQFMPQQQYNPYAFPQSYPMVQIVASPVPPEEQKQ